MSVQLRLEQVSFAAGAVRHAQKSLPPMHYLLHNISFEVAKSEIVAIVGASGSGKTTLLRLLNRLIDPIDGTLYVEHQRLRDVAIVDLRQQILFVPQEPKLFGMTVREALRYPLLLRNLKETDARIETWMDRLRIPREWLDRTELQLSTGERQWIAIARALVCQSPILLLDEPTANLDAGRCDRLREILLETQQTVLVATHDLNWAQQICDPSEFGRASRVLHLQRGVLVQNEQSDRVDWQLLRTAIVQAEAEEQAEWE